MTAIWPAGPPKVCRDIANQVRTAVRKGTMSRPLSVATTDADSAVG
jgi:hypothetical protein